MYDIVDDEAALKSIDRGTFLKRRIAYIDILLALQFYIHMTNVLDAPSS